MLLERDFYGNNSDMPIKLARTSPRTRRRPAEVRGLLLEAAETAFASGSYSSVSMDSVACAAGVAPSALYRHFPTKDDLFRAVVLQPFVSFLDDYKATWASQEKMPWDEARLMKAMVGEFYDHFQKHRNAALTLAMLDNDATGEMRAKLDDFFKQMLRIGTEEAHRRAWFPEQDLDLTIRMVLGMVASTVLLDKLFLSGRKPRHARDKVVNHLTDLALYGLRRKDPNSGV